MPMQRSKCPDCNSDIGGSNHVALASNVKLTASEVENLTRKPEPGYHGSVANVSSCRKLTPISTALLIYYEHLLLRWRLSLPYDGAGIPGRMPLLQTIASGIDGNKRRRKAGFQADLDKSVLFIESVVHKCRSSLFASTGFSPMELAISTCEIQFQMITVCGCPQPLEFTHEFNRQQWEARFQADVVQVVIQGGKKRLNKLAQEMKNKQRLEALGRIWETVRPPRSFLRPRALSSDLSAFLACPLATSRRAALTPVVPPTPLVVHSCYCKLGRQTEMPTATPLRMLVCGIAVKASLLRVLFASSKRTPCSFTSTRS